MLIGEADFKVACNNLLMYLFAHFAVVGKTGTVTEESNVSLV
jgi:hypothetical protein